MTNMKIIKGARRELEYQLLAALFTPGCQAAAESLKQRLAARGKGRVHAVSTTASASPNEPPPAPEPVDDQT
jgi:hypothetical protein